MFATPQYSLSSLEKGSVYEPAEDTFVLLDALEKDWSFIQDRCPLISLEIGCGSGVVSAFVAKLLGSHSVCLCTDLNWQACNVTQYTAALNKVNLLPVVTDLYKALEARTAGKVDLLLFNPPYVPTTNAEHEQALSQVNSIANAWAGGPQGTSALMRLLNGLHELLAPAGVFYFVALNTNNVPALLSHGTMLRFHCTVVFERKCGIERLFVLRFAKPIN